MAYDRKLKLKVTEEELTQTIPKEWVGAKSISKDLGYEIAYELREYIRSRVARGKGIGGETFSPNVYSKSYQKSEAFKIYGKSPKPVNMRLTGDMLGSIRIDTTKDGMPIVTLDDPEVTPRAHGHQTGQYGRGPLPERPWFGVTEDEFKKKILPKFKDAIEKSEATEPVVDKIKYDKVVDIMSATKNLIGEVRGIKKIIKLVK